MVVGVLICICNRVFYYFGIYIIEYLVKFCFMYMFFFYYIYYLLNIIFLYGIVVIIIKMFFFINVYILYGFYSQIIIFDYEGIEVGYGGICR